MSNLIPFHLGVLTLVGMLATASQALAATPMQLEPRIVGGIQSQACAWPSTVGVNNCTGTLLHPKVVVYAAHCGDKITEIVLGPSTLKPERVVETERCETYPSGGVQGNDYAYCVLKEPVEDVPIIPPAMGADTQRIQIGLPVWAVGYGYYNQAREFGIKHEVELEARNFIGDNDSILVAGGDGKDACQGDSGGPLFTRLPNNRGFRVIGVTSFGYEGPTVGGLACGYGGGWALLHHQMAWLETQSGFDLTPCHNAQGEPDPDDRCGIAPLEPGQASGQWPDQCKWGELSPASKNLPPSVRWAESAKNLAGTVGESVDVEVLAKDAGGLARVELSVNGRALDPKSEPPFRWSFVVPDAPELKLRAFAIDPQGLRSDAQALDFALRVRSSTGISTPPPSVESGGSSTEPAQAPPPEPPRADEGCSMGHASKAPVTLALLALLGLGRRRSPGNR